jgi:glycosyltransferase involved in cell wall biosynthesis
VIVTGPVSDVRPWLQAADVVVAPLGIARGVQNKVLEAMAMARPVVASPAAYAGIDAESGRDLIVAPLGHEAPQLIALLGDPVGAGTLGRNARLRMEARYGWDARLAPLAAMVGREPASTVIAA